MGNFDGVHRGHADILSKLVACGQATGTPTLLYTFDPHPAKVLAPDVEFYQLQTMAQRLETLAQCGLTATVVEPFTPAFAAMPAQQFFETIIRTQLAPRQLMVGYDLTFGRHRAGRVAELLTWCAQAAIPCTVIEPVFHKEALISSTYIRRCLASGLITEANDALGRPYALRGTVVRGHGIGRQLGFPTINIVPDNELIPPEGVYVSAVRVDCSSRATFPSATYIGRRPTFGGTAQVVETYLLTTDPGSPATVEVLIQQRLRGDIHFATPDQLKTQIEKDVAAARSFHGC